MSTAINLDDLRRYAIARSLFAPTTLPRAIDTLGFVQADPIRAPARAQDLTLRHRVLNYHAGDLERRYPKLGIEEDFFINYGFLPHHYYALMHPRAERKPWGIATRRRAQAVLAFIRERGLVHPREVDVHFAHGSVTNYWGGSSNATTHLLDGMHYRGLLRVARRDNGVRVYAALEQAFDRVDAAKRRTRVDALIDVVVRKYAPLPALTLNAVVLRLRYAAPQFQGELKRALARAKQRLRSARVDGVDWYWPEDEDPVTARDIVAERVRFLAPFDPLVWDRRRFELFWSWAYRFEAYTPPPKRKLGYYALPLLWRDQVVGWTNLQVRDGELTSDFGYVSGDRPQARSFKRELESEVESMRAFLRL